MTTTENPWTGGDGTAKEAGRSSWFRRLQSAVFARIQHRGARTVADGDLVEWNPRMLRGRHCILVSYRANGIAVPTPIWTATDGDRVYVRTGSDAYKLRRIRRNPDVLLAPSTSRGKPTGAAMPGHARVLDRDEEPAAERALRARHGLLRQLYSTTVDAHLSTVYIAIGPRPVEDPTEESGGAADGR